MEVVNKYEFNWSNTFKETGVVEADSFHGSDCSYISSRWYMEEYNYNVSGFTWTLNHLSTPLPYPHNKINCYGEPYQEFFGLHVHLADYYDMLARKHTFWSYHELIFNPPLKNVIFIGEVEAHADRGRLNEAFVEHIEGLHDFESDIWREINSVWIAIQMSATGDDYISWRSYYNDDHSKWYRTYRQYIGEGITIYIHALSLAEPEAIGYMEVMDDNKKEKLKIVNPADTISFDFENSLRIKLPSGETGSADLVDVNAMDISNVRVMTPNGIRAWRKET
ncbi:MAG TPA: hypothetical protein VFC79_12980 [Tissierellaceae bacterium]|nr:hypothetical protein [Tissierellaceae bacterium]